MPSGPWSTAAARVRPSTAALAVAYGSAPRTGRRAWWPGVQGGVAEDGRVVHPPGQPPERPGAVGGPLCDHLVRRAAHDRLDPRPGRVPGDPVDSGRVELHDDDSGTAGQEPLDDGPPHSAPAAGHDMCVHPGMVHTTMLP